MCRVTSWCKKLKIDSNVLDHNKQTNKKQQQSFILTTHILLLHRFDVYIYTNLIYAIHLRVDIKHLMSRNKKIKFKKKMSKWL